MPSWHYQSAAAEKRKSQDSHNTEKSKEKARKSQDSHNTEKSKEKAKTAITQIKPRSKNSVNFRPSNHQFQTSFISCS
jgi:hypothetical protein